MNCQELAREVETVREARDGAARPPWSADLSLHAGACDACRLLLAREDALWSQYAALRAQEPEVSASFRRGVRLAVEARTRRQRRSSWPLAVSGLASAAALALIAFVSWREPARPGVVLARPMQATQIPASAPTLWSDGRVEIVGSTTPASAPQPSPAKPSSAAPSVPDPRPVAVLVEYRL
jgi:hypothetical protein